MCIQNLRQSIENNSYVVNETSAEVMQLKDFANFNNPMVDVSRSLQRTKVGDVPHQLILLHKLPLHIFHAHFVLFSISSQQLNREVIKGFESCSFT